MKQDRITGFNFYIGPTGKWVICPSYKENCGFKQSDVKLIAHILQSIGHDLEDGTADDVIIKWQ